MANYTVQVANPRRKKGKKKAKKKAAKRKTTKKRGKKKAKKKATKKRAKKKATKKKATKKRAKKKGTKKKVSKAARSRAAKKAAKTRAKKKKARSTAAKKAAKTRAKGKKKPAKRKPAKKKATKKRKAKKNPAQSWTLLSSKAVADKYGVEYKKGKWILRKGGRVLAGPLTKTQMERYKGGAGVSTGVRLRRAREMAAGTARGGKARSASGKKRLALKAASAEGKALVRLTRDIEETKTELGGEARALAEAVGRLTKARRKDKSKLADLEAQVKAAKSRATKARKRGDLTKKDEERLQDRLTRSQAALKRCRVALKDARSAPAPKRKKAKKATKKKAKRASRKKAPARRRRKPSWPSNVPRPGFAGVPERLTVEQAIHRLSKAGQYLRHGASASGRRMQLASKGYLQLNPLEDIPDHPGLVAQFKSDKATRARAVAAKTPRSVKPKGKKPVKGMTAREKQAILRRALRGT